MSLLRRPTESHASISTQPPLARSSELVVEELEDELLVYDERGKRAHCLSATANRVWRACDGERDAGELAEMLELDRDAVTRALEELEAADLLEVVPQIQILNGNGNGNGHKITRRELTRRSAQVGVAAVAAPMILSITAPEAWATVTPIPFFCNIYTTQDCGASTGCGSIAGCCCCSKGCPGEGSCKGCTSVAACTGGHQQCANSNNTAGTDCSDAKGTNPFNKCGCCSFYPNLGSCGCGFGPATSKNSSGVPTSGYQPGTTTPGSGCCDITSTGPDPNGPVGHKFVMCTNTHTCVPCCGGRPIYPSASSEFGCCSGFASGSGNDTCNHTPPVGYLPVNC